MLHGDLLSLSDSSVPSSGSIDCPGSLFSATGSSIPRTNIELVRNLVNFCSYLRSVIIESRMYAKDSVRVCVYVVWREVKGDKLRILDYTINQS